LSPLLQTKEHRDPPEKPAHGVRSGSVLRHLALA
jgi:hypothetical protein